MDNVIKYITGFFTGLASVLMAVIPVSILWYVLTAGSVFGIEFEVKAVSASQIIKVIGNTKKL
jgi:hypothetical protein